MSTFWEDVAYDRPRNMFRDRPASRIGIWRTKEGREIPIVEMEDSHLKNAIRYLENKFPEQESNLSEWKIYKELIAESMKRNLNDREWDA